MVVLIIFNLFCVNFFLKTFSSSSRVVNNENKVESYNVGGGKYYKSEIERHIPVLAKEVVDVFRNNFSVRDGLLEESLDLKDGDSLLNGKTIVDGTLGDGGHSELFLENGAFVIGVDQDDEALSRASSYLLPKFIGRIKMFKDNFSNLNSLMDDLIKVKSKDGFGLEEGYVDGIFLDLGVSTIQLLDKDRGFSFMKDGELDMRMGDGIKKDAKFYLNNLDEDFMVKILRDFGQEPRARRIASEIVRMRMRKDFYSTEDLKEVVRNVYGYDKTNRGRDVASRTFQAFRIYVNRELLSLESVLPEAVKYLGEGGILAIITYHSLEDRIVKNFFRDNSRKYINKMNLPEPVLNKNYCLNIPKRKSERVIYPSEKEIERNPRARSAKLRVAFKV